MSNLMSKAFSMGLGLLVAGLLVVPAAHSAPPPPPYGSTLAALNGGNPNGTWALFVQDDAIFDAGSISNGWVLTLITADPVGFVADIALSMTASSTNILVGSNVVYIIGVTNYGPSAASNVVVLGPLPSGFTLVATNLTQGFVSHSGFDLIWNVGSLATNAGARLTLTGQANDAGSMVNFAFASTTTSDPNPDDDVASATVNVVVPAAAVLSGGSVINGMFQLTVTGTPGVSYIIQASTNLASANWVNIYTSAPPFTSPFTFTSLDSTNFPTRFYRALLGP